MTDRLNAESLLDLVQETLRTEIMPSLPADKRYTVAMLANAIDIAQREVAVEADALHLALLDAFYEDGDGTLADMARQIRSGSISEEMYPDIRKRLRAYLVHELQVRNPRFLISRGVKKDTPERRRT